MKTLQVFVTLFLPFLLVDACWAVTMGSFDPISVFQDVVFWGISCIYWICLMWIPLTIIFNDEEEEEDEDDDDN